MAFSASCRFILVVCFPKKVRGPGSKGPSRVHPYSTGLMSAREGGHGNQRLSPKYPKINSLPRLQTSNGPVENGLLPHEYLQSYPVYSDTKFRPFKLYNSY